jgi:(p)ppGpp synthase/HD superfamily hydrolase
MPTPPLLGPAFEEALQYAAALHRAQRRKGGDVPYVAHLLAVTAHVLEHGGDQDEAIAALLHDAVEDQGGASTRDEILQRFGARVCAIVDGCTDTDVTPKPPWRARKEAFLRRLTRADRSVALVVGCDKLHNLRSVVNEYRQAGEALWERFRGGREGSLWYYERVSELLADQLPATLLAELQRVYAELQSLLAATAASDST